MNLPKLRLAPDDTHIRFMWLRRYVFPATVLLSIAAVAIFVFIGPNYGIDFRGGTLIEIKPVEASYGVAEVRQDLATLQLGDVQVTEVADFTGDNSILIRIQQQEGGEAAQQVAVEQVRTMFADEVEFRRVEVVGPRVSSELAYSATIAVVVTLFAILAYIWFRFEWQFALGAIISTVHDVLLTLGFFVVAGLDFNLASIAAILTIVGYSLNDTVVVYDRIRENLRKYKKMPLTDLIDKSINEMLARTLMTSVTTCLALLALLIFGGTVIRSFIAAMLFGVLIGTYSSIYIAAPVLIFFKLRPAESEKKDEADAVETAEA